MTTSDVPRWKSLISNVKPKLYRPFHHFGSNFVLGTWIHGAPNPRTLRSWSVRHSFLGPRSVQSADLYFFLIGPVRFYRALSKLIPILPTTLSNYMYFWTDSGSRALRFLFHRYAVRPGPRFQNFVGPCPLISSLDERSEGTYPQKIQHNYEFHGQSWVVNPKPRRGPTERFIG